jgi:hypothetical protein
MVHNTNWMKYLPLLLAFVLLSASYPARAQMTGNFSTDVAMVNSALATTLVATGKTDASTSHVAMQELYRLWLQFRAKNYEDPVNGPQFVSDMNAVQAKLYAASKLIDGRQLETAHSELKTADTLLQAARQRHGKTSAY